MALWGISESIPYSGKFSWGPNFCYPRRKHKNKNRQIKWTFVWTFELEEVFTRAFCALVSLDLTMALYRYFKLPDDVLPSPTGDLSPVCLPGDNKGAWLIACAKRENSGGETRFSRKLDQRKFPTIRYARMQWNLSAMVTMEPLLCRQVGVYCFLQVLIASSIPWFVELEPILQKIGEGDWVHSRVGNPPSSEKLPACHTIGPLQKHTNMQQVMSSQKCNDRRK